MSTEADGPARPAAPNVRTVRARKGSGPPLVMVTAYDAPGAGMASDAGVDMILVGDSVAMAVLGYPDTLSIAWTRWSITSAPWPGPAPPRSSSPTCPG